MQSWPVLYKMPSAAQVAAVSRHQQPPETMSVISSPGVDEDAGAPWSRSALSKTKLGDFPPSSKDTFFRLLSAAAAMIFRPVTVLPVNAILSTPLCADRAAPPTDPSEVTVFKTPGGKLHLPSATPGTKYGACSPSLDDELGKFLVVTRE